MRRSPRVNQEVLLRATFFGWSAGLFFKNGRTGCLLKVSGGSRVKRAGDVPALVSCEVGRRADPGSAPVCLSGMRPGDADPLQQPSGDRVAAGFGSPAPEDPAL